jgi:hypothetical protein
MIHAGWPWILLMLCTIAGYKFGEWFLEGHK